MSVQVASAPQVNRGRAAAPLPACGPGRRILAHGIDLAAVGAVTAAAYLPTGSVLLGAVLLLEAALGLAVWEARSGRTLGKHLLGVRAAQARSDYAPGLRRGMVRSLLLGASHAVVLVGQFLLIATTVLDRTGRGQAWHDRVAGTRVVNVRPDAHRKAPAPRYAPAVPAAPPGPYGTGASGYAGGQGAGHPHPAAAPSGQLPHAAGYGQGSGGAGPHSYGPPPGGPVPQAPAAPPAGQAPAAGGPPPPGPDAAPDGQHSAPGPAGPVADLPQGQGLPGPPTGAVAPAHPWSGDLPGTPGHQYGGAGSGTAGTEQARPVAPLPPPVPGRSAPGASTQAGLPEHTFDPAQPGATPADPRTLHPTELPDLEDVRDSGASAVFVLTVDDGVSVTVSGNGLIGRRPQAGPGERVAHLVAVDDPGRSLSRTHAAFGIDGDELWVQDRGSANGTVVVSADGTTTRAFPGTRVPVPEDGRIEAGERSITVQRWRS
ncbi:RDD family protein [Pseudactinotalea sp. Z1739]|uniref:RDD family protein n=1 Tax=Pseudactinotalea sp. Z1739 TaxID=3413028 RepID=UPI003C7BEC91